MWAELKSRPSERNVLVLCAALLVLHQLVHRAFFIDDSAIVFTFARNIAAGEGVVPWPGGERIEAFSDPTWVALLTLFQAVGLDGFTVAKPLAVVLGFGTLPLVWRIARFAMPDHEGPAAVFAPVALALSAQYAIWSASGLENALFAFLLALGIERTLAELRWGGFAGSAVAWLLLAWTRPEGIVYAAVGGFWFLGSLARSRKPLRPVAGWLAVFWIPTALLEVARIEYFAWPLPQTYYAKLVTRSTFPLVWNQRGWNQLREYASRLWQGYLVPLYLIGLLGRRRVTWLLLGGLGLLFLYPAPSILSELSIWPHLPAPPEPWLKLRIVLLVAAMVGAPFAEVGRPGWEARVLCWHTAAFGALFAVYANGDWMGGYRWMSLFVPSVAVLFAVGLREVVDGAERWLGGAGEREWGPVGWLVVAFGIGVWIPPNLDQSRDHLYFNGDETAPRMVARVDYTDSVRKELFYDGVVNNLEMDQGGTTWKRPDYVQVDMAGLVDIPMAHHNYGQRAFIEQYVFGEHEPTFAHVHGWWSAYSAFKTYPQWRDYFELPKNPEPGMGGAPIQHDGMWANRKMLFGPSWGGDERPVGFDQGVVLHGVAPAAAWPTSGDGYLEVGLSSPPRPAGDDLTVVAFLARDGALAASWSLPLGSGLIGMDQWRVDEVYTGRWAVVLPKLAPGTYDLGLVVFDADGAVLPAGGAAGDQPLDEAFVYGGRDDVPAVLATGEVRAPNAVVLEDPGAVARRTEAARDEAVALAKDGSCEEAEQRWIAAKRLQPRQWDLHERLGAPVAAALADCYALRAEREPGRAPELLAVAHRWDHDSPELARVGGPVGDRLWAEGMAARAAEQPAKALDRFTALLGFQPWRAWARRYAEEARDVSLRLDHKALWNPVIRQGKDIPEGFGPDGPLPGPTPQADPDP